MKVHLTAALALVGIASAWMACTGPVAPLTAEVVENVAPSAAVPSAPAPTVSSDERSAGLPRVPASAGEAPPTVAHGVVVRVEVLSAEGAFDSDAWKQAISPHESALAACVPASGAGARGGAVTIELAVDAAARATAPGLAASSLDDKRAVECIKSELGHIAPAGPAGSLEKSGGAKAKVRVTLSRGAER